MRGSTIPVDSLSRMIKSFIIHYLPCERGGKFLVHLPQETTRRSSGRVWRKVPDDILSYLGVGLNLSARRLPPPLLRPRFVALSSDFVECTFIPFPESTA